MNVLPLLILCGTIFVSLLQKGYTSDTIQINNSYIKYIKGQRVRLSGREVIQYLGIPFAQPPAEPLRFKEPLSTINYSQEFEAITNPPACPQYTTQPWDWYINSTYKNGDCLYLNIWTPADASSTNRKAVLYWIHGGVYSSRTSEPYSGIPMASLGGMIVVTVNYRMGPFIFLSSETEDAPRKEGLWDLLEGLKWVNQYIDAFGGDLTRITIAGKSAGAVTAGFLTISPLAKGLYTKLVLESVSRNSTRLSDDNTQIGALIQQLASIVGCANETYSISVYPMEVVRCLKEQEALSAVNVALKLKKNLKFEIAQRFYFHALSLESLHPDILNHYGEFLEEKDNDVIKADHFYVRALSASPQHSRALANRKRTLPVVDKMDEQELEKIDEKRLELFQPNHNNPSLKRVEKETYFEHIFQNVAIEGLALYETKTLVKTRKSASSKSVKEQNKFLGLESALRYINKNLINKDVITVPDILAIHKQVLGLVNSTAAGSFRKVQVFVGQHTPPKASNVAILMEKFVEWLQSEGTHQLHPVKRAALTHLKLVYIHPFVDGNGRTARLLMNMILRQNGYPPVTISKADRTLYRNVIRLAQAHKGDVRPFIRFIAHVIECTLNVYLHAQEYGAKCFDGFRTYET